MVEARCRDRECGDPLLTVATLATAPQGRQECVAGHQLDAEVIQDSNRVAHRGRLDQSREHELEEGLIGDHVQPQTGPRGLDDLDQPPRELRLHHRLHRGMFRTEVEDTLALLDLARAILANNANPASS